MRAGTGSFRVHSGISIVAVGGDGGPAAAAARMLKAMVRRRAGLSLRVSRDAADEDGRIVAELVPHQRHEQWYRLLIGTKEIRLLAGTLEGFRHGVTTLGQLLAAGRRIAAMEIEDWPDFEVRGVMLDISRDKVPTTRTLLRLVDLLADWKINQLQLYMEHTFAYRGHERVWRGASPLTGSEIRRIDRYCRERGIELVPNQNSFGHMERWLRHEPYRRLAETDQPWRTPFGTVRDYPATLCPLDPGSIRLVGDLYRQLLPNFSSRLLNVGLDETFELGQGRSRGECRSRGTGRVYLDYLLKVHRLVARHDHRMMFWADIILKYPGLIRHLPKDAIALLWGYEGRHPFDRECRRVASCGLPFYVCPGTSSWCSFAGRTRNAMQNLRHAARAGLRHGASGYLITDWGDFGHRQCPPVSLGPLLYGASVSWCGHANAALDVGEEVDRHVVGDPGAGVGELWLRAGDVHLASGVRLMNRSVLFKVMECGLEEIPAIKGLKASSIRKMQQAIEVLSRDAAGVKFSGAEGRLMRSELRVTLDVMRHACRRAMLALQGRNGAYDEEEASSLAADMRRIMRRHRALWLARNRTGGLSSSLSYYEKLVSEYGCIRASRSPGEARQKRRGGVDRSQASPSARRRPSPSFC